MTQLSCSFKNEGVSRIISNFHILLVKLYPLLADFEKLKSKTSKSYRKTKKVKEKREKTTEEMIAEENGSEPIKFLLNKLVALKFIVSASPCPHLAR